MTSTADVRKWYAEFIVRSVGSASERLQSAFAAVPREGFLGPGPWQIVAGSGYMASVDSDPRCIYQDLLVGLAPDKGINNGQPSLHAKCLDAAAPELGGAVVHVGAGSGYYTAILATLVGMQGRVTAYEADEELAVHARDNLRAFSNVCVLPASATDRVLPECDVIYVNAGASHPPAAWLDALRIGGRLVFPLTGPDGQGAMLKVTRRGQNAYDATAFARAAFIPCIGARDDSDAAAVSAAMQEKVLKDVKSLRRDSNPDATAWCIGDGWWLSTTPLAAAP